jgi:hypothetical protein
MFVLIRCRPLVVVVVVFVVVVHPLLRVWYVLVPRPRVWLCLLALLKLRTVVFFIEDPRWKMDDHVCVPLVSSSLHCDPYCTTIDFASLRVTVVQC